ncbi:MAG: phage tail sheath subtilisin-like domain-containing protein [Balneolaceae bacterium]|nr:phage tail sheath subtilisin-like domain-containing protein [Balneolaceae bacterium]
MPNYKTPDVHVEEISTFPPSVAQVETAIPAFIGYTKKKTRKGKTLINKPVRIQSLLQFVETFGGAPDPDTITVRLSDDNAVEEVTINPQYFLYDSMRMFFANGGGDCYVVSVGKYDDDISLGDLTQPDSSPGLSTGLTAVEKIDEPTILVFPDAVLLDDEVKLGDLQKQALGQCNKLMDRFAVLDVYEGDQERTYNNQDIITRFRNNTGMQALKYGAAYYPWVRSSLDYKVDYQNISLEKASGATDLASISSDPEIVNDLEDAFTDITTIENFLDDPAGTGNSYSDISIDKDKGEMVNRAVFIDKMLEEFLNLSFENKEVQKAYSALTEVTSEKSHPDIRKYAITLTEYDKGYPSSALGQVTAGDYPSAYEIGSVSGVDIYTPSSGTDNAENRTKNGRARFQQLYDNIMKTLQGFLNEAKEAKNMALETVKETNTIYQEVLNEISKEALTLPPSGAIAGVYATVDSNRGVWKAPANVSLSNVTGPAVNITSDEQRDLNVDASTGKSINAIRQFTGKGTMVWGQELLLATVMSGAIFQYDGSSTWSKSQSRNRPDWAVFEPNDANTWVKVRTMIENYLTQKWREGALAGSKPDQAFFVKVGLGQTMTQQDILEGRMNVEIGMAVVRPAEFIILKFSHKMQEA